MNFEWISNVILEPYAIFIVVILLNFFSRPFGQFNFNLEQSSLFQGEILHVARFVILHLRSIKIIPSTSSELLAIFQSYSLQRIFWCSKEMPKQYPKEDTCTYDCCLYKTSSENRSISTQTGGIKHPSNFEKEYTVFTIFIQIFSFCGGKLKLIQMVLLILKRRYTWLRSEL